jgi:hypothetical protein
MQLEEAVMVESIPAHVDLFRRLRPSLRRDLTTTIGFPNAVAGSILNWFDPANPQYLEHVDAWQKLLCNNVAVKPPPFIDSDVEGRVELNDWNARAIQQVAKLVYKWHGDPSKKTDWCQVASRLSKPLPLRLTDDEITGIRECLSGIRPIDLNQAIGRFGPGTTCESFNARDKWTRKGLIPDVPTNLYRASPRDTWCPAGHNAFRYTRMAEVPKSIKANRTVSSEPAMSMYAQLAINDDLVNQIHWLWPAHVSLHDQEKHNRLLKRPGMATLDLSDASDHVSCELVERVLPQLWPVLAKVRSEYTVLPNGELVQLRTFAPMGAGFCFSVMTTVILGIITYAFKSMFFSWRREPWSVYGDDIIVPIWICDYIVDLLERAGLVINASKSCFSGHYVESCGLELRHNVDVTPCYLRDPLSTLDASKVEQIALKLCEQYPSTLEAILAEAAPVKGMRWNKDTQESELLVRTNSVRSKLSILDGYAGLNRWFAVGTRQETYWRKDSLLAKPTGVELEVWTKEAWRYRSSINYPFLSLWFATRA